MIFILTTTQTFHLDLVPPGLYVLLHQLLEHDLLLVRADVRLLALPAHTRLPCTLCYTPPSSCLILLAISASSALDCRLDLARPPSTPQQAATSSMGSTRSWGQVASGQVRTAASRII